MSDGEYGKVVYVTRYALTDGILKLRARVRGEMVTIIGSCNESYHGKDWYFSPEKAICRAYDMRCKSIESTKKKIKRLEALDYARITERDA